MELLERDHFFSMLSIIGLHIGLKIYFFRPMRLLNLVVIYIYIYREREVTFKMCNYYLQIRVLVKILVHFILKISFLEGVQGLLLKY